MVNATKFAADAEAGNLLPYGDALSYKDDIYPKLRESFTSDGKFYCAPKDFSTLALRFVRDLLTSGVAKFPKQLGAGDGSEAFGTGKAAMVIDGNWMIGGMREDYPDVKYRVVPLPKGPAGSGTLSFTECWGISAKSEYQEQAKSLVDGLMEPQQQLTFAEVFGVMPSRQSARAQYEAKFPDQAGFLQGVENAQGPVTHSKMDPVMTDLDNKLQQLPGIDPAQVLKEFQQNATAALGG